MFLQVSVMKDQEMRNSFGEDLPHLHDLGRSSLWYSAIDKEMLGCFIIISVNDDCELVLRTIITSAEREVKVSRRSGMYQSYNFLTRLGMQSL